MGFVLREASQSDGRISHLHLTEAGRQLYSRLIPQVTAIVERADGRMSMKSRHASASSSAS